MKSKYYEMLYRRVADLMLGIHLTQDEAEDLIMLIRARVRPDSVAHADWQNL